MTYKFLEHTADVKILAQATTMEQTFIETSMALKQSIAEDVDVKPVQEQNLEIQGKDLENLLYNFLEEFIFLLDAEDFLLSKIKNLKIDKQNFKLTCTAIGDNAKNYKFNFAKY